MDAHIMGIDTDLDSLDEAQYNFGKSPWPKRLQTIHVGFQNFHTEKRFDYIVCNPPYFSGALQGPETRKNNARHMEPDGFTTLALQISRLLSPEGIFGCILPEKEWTLFSAELRRNLLFPRRCRAVFPKPGVTNKVRFLSEWSPIKKDPITEPDLFLRSKMGLYSEEYKKLTRSFYLKEAFIGL